jgi:hypothetical protein
MSNRIARSGIAPSNTSHRHLFHCAAVALALAAATVITMPKLETAAVTTSDTSTQTIVKTAPETGVSCVQSWPYYERSCLRDSRQRDSSARTVRLIATGSAASRHASRQ